MNPKFGSAIVLTSRPFKNDDHIRDLKERVRNLNKDNAEEDCIQASNAVRQYAKQFSSSRQSFQEITVEQSNPRQSVIRSDSNSSLPAWMTGGQILPPQKLPEIQEEEYEEEWYEDEEYEEAKYEEAEQPQHWFGWLPSFLKTGLGRNH